MKFGRKFLTDHREGVVIRGECVVLSCECVAVESDVFFTLHYDYHVQLKNVGVKVDVKVVWNIFYK